MFGSTAISRIYRARRDGTGRSRAPRRCAPVYVDRHDVRRRVHNDLAVLRTDAILHRPSTAAGRPAQLRWLAETETVLALDLSLTELETVFDDWRRRRAAFVSAREARRTDRLFPAATYRQAPSPFLRDLLRRTVPAQG